VGKEGERRPGGSRALRTASAGGQLVVIFLAGFLGGRWLDARLHTTPWLTVVGILLGFVVGLLSAYRALMRP
jgi:F0F1-type ATP synthase assembly protein I